MYLLASLQQHTPPLRDFAEHGITRGRVELQFGIRRRAKGTDDEEIQLGERFGRGELVG